MVKDQVHSGIDTLHLMLKSGFEEGSRPLYLHPTLDPRVRKSLILILPAFGAVELEPKQSL